MHNWWHIHIYGIHRYVHLFIKIELISEFNFSSHRFILIVCSWCTWKTWIGRRYSSYRKFFTALLAGKIDLVLMINMWKWNMKIASNKAKAIWKFGCSIRSKVSIKIKITALIQWKIKRNVKNRVFNIYIYLYIPCVSAIKYTSRQDVNDMFIIAELKARQRLSVDTINVAIESCSIIV